MPVPGSINDLSTSEASNSPPGGEAVFPLLDNYLRTFGAFIAQLRDSVALKLNTSATTAFTLTLLDDADAATARATLGIPAQLPRYSTAEIVLSMSTTAPAGTLATNGQTIGSASSGATARANADTEPLFTALWNSTANTELIIQTSAGSNTTRGASAAADFAANKRLPLPEWQDGEALVASVSSAVAARTAGENVAHGHTGSIASGGSHSHAIGIGTSEGDASNTATNGTGRVTQFSTDADGSHTHTLTIDSSGGTKNKAAGLFTRVYIAL